ncbi:hypothetical protein VTG60DRAFT_4633 [Thermothelomyces hinnuleus]
MELRLQIWLSYLQQHRMIEVEIGLPADEDETSYPGEAPHSRYYKGRNHLDRIVSGRGYTLSIKGRGSYAASLSPLFWVSQEARRAALSFYHIRLPLQCLHGERILYLNSDYDVLYVRPQQPEGAPFVRGGFPRLATILVDILHDIKAHDSKDQGVAHLTLSIEYWVDLLLQDHVPMTPGILHPVAAKSFADILRTRLRSVLCVVGFRHPTRGLGEFPVKDWHFHFAQTSPLYRRGHPTGAFHWLRADPRPGVEIDLRQVPLDLFVDTDHLSRSWEELERAFGITRAQQRAA